MRGAPAVGNREELLIDASTADWSEEWDDAPSVLDAVRRYRIGVVLATVLGALSALLLSLTQPTLYSASARAILAEPSAELIDSSLQGVDSERRASNAAIVASTLPVAQRVKELLDDERPAGVILRGYEVVASENADLIAVTAVGSTGEEAAARANAVVRAYEDEARAQIDRRVQAAVGELDARIRLLREESRDLGAANDTTLGAQREEYAQRIGALDGQIARLQFERFVYGSGVSFVDPALPPADPDQPAPVRAAAAGGLVTAVAAAGLAWWRHGRTQTVEDRHEPARVLSAPLLAEVPSFSRAGAADAVPAASAPFSRAGEAYQFLVSSLAYALGDRANASILVTSAVPGDGKSVTALNLAIAASRGERRVVAVDADVRLRGLSTLAGVGESAAGLTDLRREDTPLDLALVPIDVGGDAHPWLVTAGDDAHDLAAFFRTSGFRTALGRLAQYADLVIVDSAPLLAVAETSAIAGQVDGIVLVVSRGTSVSVLRDVAERLHFIGTPLLGYVFNKGDEHRSYGTYSGYTRPPPATKRVKRTGGPASTRDRAQVERPGAA